jgi:predicted enzyme related to lactoylglutathione lyase
MGHLHLHVGDIDEGLAFYRDALGFEVQANLGSAAFVSAGGYHHHLGFNVWNGHGAGPAPAHTAGLRRWTVQLPTDDDVTAVRDRVAAAGHDTEPATGGFLVRDPWQTAVAIVSTAATGLAATARIATAKPSPYLLQLAKHFRHKLDVRFDGHTAVIPFAFGHAELRAADGELVIAAFAHTPRDLRRVEEVVGSHLERFGRRDELTVAWERPAARS